MQTRIARSSITVLIAALMLLTAACTSDSADQESSEAPEASEAFETGALAKGEPMDLDVFVYNIEYSGDETTDRVIKEVDADIVGVLESYNRLPEIARKTGYPYYNVGLQILSKYPIHEPSGADGLYSLIEVQPGYVVAFFNTHLDYVDYGPKLLDQGMPVDEVIASENEVRTSSMEILTPDMEALLGQDYPVFLTGDFNEPSSLDYAEETVGTRKGINEPVPWPVSELLFGIEMRDTFREIHPDPLENPGLTHDNPGFAKEGTGDRIDFLYAGGPVETKKTWLVGEKGGPDVDRGFTPWTSDHRAVLSSFELSPVALGQTLSLKSRMLDEGEEVGVYYNAPGNDQTSIAVLPEEADVAEALETQETGESGTASFSGNLEPGGYDIVILDAEGSELERNSFWVRSQEDDVVIETGKDTYTEGEPIDVSWDDGPANRWDWIGVYRRSAPDPRVHDYLLWGYVGGHEAGALPPQVFGGMTLNEDSQGKPWPLPAGKYRIHYLLADKYNTAGYVDVKVVEG